MWNYHGHLSEHLDEVSCRQTASVLGPLFTYIVAGVFIIHLPFFDVIGKFRPISAFI